MKSIKTNQTRFAFVMAVIFAATIFIAGAQTPKEELGFILSMTEFKIKNGQDDQFREGIKAWKKCYLDNGGEWTWSIWQRYQGEGNVYVLTSRMEKWAELDEEDDAAKKCRDIVKNQIMPYVESSNDNFARQLPAISKEGPNTDPVIWVTYWRVNNWLKFREIAGQLTDEVRKAEGSSRSYWYSMAGGASKEADCFIVTPFKDFAAMDVERDGAWTIFENVHGKEKRDLLQAEFRATIDESWSYIFKKADDLSHTK